MMIGTPQVDQVVEPTLHLIVVVGHIGHEVRVLAVFLQQNTVLIIAEIGGTEPGGAILVVQVTLLVHDLKRAGDGRRTVFVDLIKAALAKPGIERGTKTGEGFTDKIEHLLVSDFTERLYALLVADALPLVAIAIDDALGDILHIAAAIALLGHLDIVTKQLHIANGNRITEDIHLNAMVVDVILFGYLITRMTHNARNGIAKRCPATMTNMHRTRRIGRHILKVDVTRSTFRQRTLTEVETLCTHTSSNGLERGRRQLNVDETRTCDLDRCDHIVFGQMINDDLRNLARIFVGQLCRTHGNGRSPIAIG